MMNVDSEQATYVDILRHGECEGGRIFRGLTDVSLAPHGLEKMHSVCVAAEQDWELIIGSPLKRCRYFAEQMAAQRGVDLLIDERLREIHFGQWDGRDVDTIWQQDYARISAWIDDPDQNTPPQGEALSAVQQRARAVYHDIAEQHQGKKILLVTHGGLIRVLLGTLLGMPLRMVNTFDVPYACLSRFALFHSAHGMKTKLLAHNYQMNADDFFKPSVRST